MNVFCKTCAVLSVVFFLEAGLAVRAQCTGDDLTAEDYRVRSVRVDALFGRVPRELQQLLAKHRGEPYRPFDDSPEAGISLGPAREASRALYLREVREYLSKARAENALGLHKFNEISVRAFATCVTIVAPEECQAAFAGAAVNKCVDVTVKAFTVQINTGSLSANLLALARSNKQRFYEQLPRPLLAFNPRFWLEQDRTYGPAAFGEINTNLLELPALLSGGVPASGAQLQLIASGRKSLREPFYEAAAHLAFKPARTFGFVADFATQRQPQGASTLFTNTARFGGQTVFKLARAQVGLGAAYRHASQRRFGAGSERFAEHAVETRAVADGRWAGGFLRGAIWFDGAAVSRETGAYRRLAALAGYAKDFHLRQQSCRLRDGQCSFPAKNAPAIGVEALFGAGRAWGRVPEYARFYGGNATGNFLYDGFASPQLAVAPAGPLIRSFGRNQAAVTAARGGTAYWNFNLTVSLPAPQWSRPLIPPIVLTEGAVSDCSECFSLKDALKNQVASGKNLYLDTTAYQRLTPEQREDLRLDPDDNLTPEETEQLRKAEEALAEQRRALQPEADRLWNQVTPLVKHLSDHANLYAVKPIVMLDLARLSTSDTAPKFTRAAVGGGLQFQLTFAKFEVGYLRTVRRLPGDQRGNFVVRMVFEKLF